MVILSATSCPRGGGVYGLSRPAGTPMNILSCPDRTGSPKSRVFGVFLQVSDPVHPILSISVDRTLDRMGPVQPDRIVFATQRDHSSA